MCCKERGPLVCHQGCGLSISGSHCIPNVRRINTYFWVEAEKEKWQGDKVFVNQFEEDMNNNGTRRLGLSGVR